jgi:hypothetical protein
MLLKVLVIIVIVTIGFLISATGLGGGGFLTTFLVAFGLLSIIGVIGLVMLAKKNKQK